MGLLTKIAGAVKWLVSAPFIAIDYALNTMADASEAFRGRIKGITEITFGKPRPPTEKIRAALRKQWLDLAPDEVEIAGVEWEGEIYYETPK